MLSEAARKDPAMSGQYDYARVANEFYPTPSKFVDCLAAHFPLHGITWWEPCAGQGHISDRVEAITGELCEVSDIMHYPDAMGNVNDRIIIADFLALTKAPEGVTGIITNPPYLTINVVDAPEWEDEDDWRWVAPLAKSYGMSGRISLAELFLRHAIALMKPVGGTVAMFLRNEFDCGRKRAKSLFTLQSYSMKVICTERPRWIEGSKGSPRHNYSWYVFEHTNQFDPTVRYAHPASSTPLKSQ